MVAIVGGNELGLGTASGSTLGGQGQRGEAAQGRSGEEVSVNAVTGNLIIQRQDELLKGVGPDANIVRTYNSRGLFSDANAGDDNGDNWRLGYSRKVYGLTGTANTAGSTITRLAEDGSIVTYAYNATRAAYVTTKGDGAYDTLTYASSTWTWTDGSSQTTETYNSSGLLTQVKDASNNTLSLTYSGNLITQITDSNGEKVTITYDTTTGKTSNILSISSYNNSTLLAKRVQYGYDSSNRLQTVTVDLSPADGSITDLKTYVTTYTYDGTSKRVASIAQTDGGRLDFTYVLVGSDYQIRTVSDTRGADVRTTSFQYDTTNRQTLVTDPAGRITLWRYDTSNQIVSIQQLSSSGADALVRYTYDALGNVTTITDARGNTTTYDYDLNGNRTRERDPLGNTVVRQFGTRNELLSETRYSVPNPGSTSEQSAQTTYYVYDSNLNLKYTVSPQGRVTQYKYSSAGLQTAAISYKQGYSVANPPTVTSQSGVSNLGTTVSTVTVNSSAPSLATLNTWVSGRDLSKTQRTDTTYDTRGQISTVTTYATIDSTGNGVVDGTQATTQYIYDQAGNLLQKIDARGVATTADATDFITQYTYDGLGRLKTALDALAQTTTYTYDDTNRTTAVQLANGLITTTTYDQAGLVTSAVQANLSSPGVALATTTYTYDKLGHLVKEVDPTGGITYHVYDTAGRRVADVDPTGAVVEYVYDDSSFTTTALKSQETLTYSSTNVVTLNLALTLPVFSGSTSALTAIATSYAGGAPVTTTSTTFATNATTGTLSLDLSASPSLRDRVVVQIYQDGVLKAEIIHTDVAALVTAGAAARGVVQTGSLVTAPSLFQQGDRVVKTIQYANTVTVAPNVDATLLTLGSTNNVRPTLDATNDRTSYTFYDRAGRKVGDLDATGALTEYVYDNTPVVTSTTAAQETLTYSSGKQVSITVQMPTSLGAGAYRAVATGYLNDAATTASVTQDFTGTSITLPTLDGLTTAMDTVQVAMYKLLPQGEQVLMAYVQHLLPVAGSVAETKNLGQWFIRGNRYIETIHYAGLVSTAAMSTLAVGTLTQGIPTGLRPMVPSGQTNRYSGQVITADGLPVLEADADGFLKVHSYNGFGQMVSDWKFLNPDLYMGSPLSGSYPRSVNLYNARGQLTGVMDPENYLTEYQYDLAGNKTAEIRYATPVVISIASLDDVNVLRPAANVLDRQTTYTYDALNRLTSQTESFSGSNQYFGYTVNTLGGPTTQTDNFATTEQSVILRQYDAQGRVTQELSAEGYGALQALGSTPSTAQVNAIWTQYGTSYTYDAAGRLLSKTGATDAAGVRAKTLYYYDTAGRLTETVNALGEVVSTFYNAFGQVRQTDRYNKRLNSTTLSGMTGGSRTAIASAIAALYDSSAREDQFSYNKRGELTTKLLGVGSKNPDNTTSNAGQETYSYNAFGDLTRHGVLTAGSTFVYDNHTYNNRGLELTAVQDAGTGTLNLTTTKVYDSFGRVIKVTDPRGVVWTNTYDGLDRRKVTANQTAGQNIETLTYDAFNNVLTQTDALGQVTTYGYTTVTDSNNVRTTKVTVTTAEGIVTSTEQNRRGQTVKVTDTRGTTVYAYDVNDRLTTITPPAGTTDSPTAATNNTYDKANHLITTTDANGVVTQFTYDIVGRVITRVVDFGTNKLNLTTRTLYDAKGEAIWSQDANGVWTQTQYDAKGQVSAVIVDPTQIPSLVSGAYSADTLATNPGTNGAAALNLRTNYSYDSRGNVLSVTKGVGETQPQTTRTIYDNAGRARFSIDALNYVTQREYDNNGNVIRTTRYATAITVPATLSETTVANAVNASNTANQVEVKVYDSNNRVIYNIDAANYVTKFTYDNAGRLIKEDHYATKLASVFTPSVNYSTTVPSVTPDAANDRTIRHFYDKDDRERYTIDAENYVTQRDYDNAGHETTRTRYGRRASVMGITVSDTTTLANLQALAYSATYDVQETSVYDAVGRLTSATDGTGAVTYHKYDKTGRETDITVANGTSDASTTHRVYDNAGRLTEETLGYGKTEAATTRYVLDKMGNRTQIINARGIALNDLVTYTTKQEFDARGLVTKITNPLGGITKTEYDAFGNAIKITDPNNNVGYFYFDTRNQARLQVDPEGYATQLEYDAFGKVVKQTRYDKRATTGYSASTTLATMLSTYLATTSGKDIATSTKYDNRGYAVESYDANNVAEYSQYGAFGNRTQLSDRRGYVYDYEYDRKGQLIREKSPAVQVVVVNADGTTTTTASQRIVNERDYDARGNVIKFREAVGTTQQRETVTTYDKADRVTRVDLPSISVFNAANDSSSTVAPNTRATYDKRGNKIEEWDLKNQRTVHYYDALNRQTAQVDVDGTLHEYTYDKVGNVLTERTYATALNMVNVVSTTRTIPIANDTFRELTFGYDANNLRTSTTTLSETLFNPDLLLSGGSGYFASTITTRSYYDANGNLVRSVDGRGFITRYFYDKLGRQTLTVDPLGYVTRLEYDAAGHVIRESRYEQGLSAATLGAVSDTSAQAPLITEVAGKGQDRVTEYDYNVRGQKIAERVLSVRYTNVTGTGTPNQVEYAVQTDYGYDANGNMLWQHRANNALTLDASGNPVADSALTSFQYDALNRMTQQLDPQIAVYNGGTGNTVATTTTRAKTEWRYDALGHRVQQTRFGLTTADNQVSLSRYDAADREIAQWDALSNRTEYNLDVAGNILRKLQSSTDVDGVAHTYSTYFNYDAKGREINRQIVTDKGIAGRQVNGDITFTRYNSYGDITALGVSNIVQQEYRYDKLGRLFWSNAETGTPTVFLYDANGNAVLEVKSATSDIGNLQSPSAVQGLAPSAVQIKFSLYDARNKVKEVFQAPMDFTELTGALTVTQQEQLNNTSTVLSQVAMHQTGGANPPGTTAEWTTKNVTGATNYTFTPPAVGTVRTELNPTQVNTGTHGQNPVSLAPENTTTTSTDPVQTQVSGNTTTTTEVSRVTTRNRTAVLNGTTVNETITETTDTTTKVTTRVFATAADALNYLNGTGVVNQQTTTTTTNTKTDRTQKVSTNSYQSFQSATTTNILLGGNITTESSLVYNDQKQITVFQVPLPFAAVNRPLVVDVPAIGGYGEGVAWVLVEWLGPGGNVVGSIAELNHIAAKQYGTQIPFSTSIANVRTRIWKGGVLLLDSTKSGYEGISYIPPIVSVDGVDDPSVQSIMFTNNGGSTYLTRVGDEWSGHALVNLGNWTTVSVNLNTNWQYTMYSAASPANPFGWDQVIGAVQGSAVNNPTNRNVAFTTKTDTAYLRKEVKDDASVNSQQYDSVQALEQRNYLRQLVYTLVSGNTLSNQINRKQGYNAYGEIASETDGRGNVTQYAYNELGKLIRKTDPQVSYTDERGVTFNNQALATTYYVDAQGQTIGQQDANGFNTTQQYTNGRLVAQFNPQNASTYYSQYYYYDVFGNLAAVTDAIGQTTRHRYDKGNRLVRTDYPTGTVASNYDIYEYDAFDQRIAHTNGLGNRETYLYDGEGRITRYRSFEGRQTSYGYTFLSTIGERGGYRKTTTDVLSNTQTHDTDMFGKLRAHTDLGGRNYVYSYNSAGWLLKQTSTAGQNIDYIYYNNGYLKEVRDSGISSYARFEYDKEGNRTMESYAQTPLTVNDQGIGYNPYQIARATYDALNRVTTVHESGKFTIEYKYDKVGNRRNVKSTYIDLLGTNTLVQDFWYKYDAMNRFTTTMGTLDASNNIVRGTTGYDVGYNGINQRKSQITTASDGSVITEIYDYDNNGFLTTVELKPTASAASVIRSRRANNAIGEVKDYYEYNASSVETSHHQYTYDKDHTLTKDADIRNNKGINYTLLTDGRTNYSVTYDANSSAATITNQYTYEAWDSYQQKSTTITATSGEVDGYWRPGKSEFQYDVNGHVRSLYDHYQARTIDYVNNQNGQTLKRLDYDKYDRSNLIVLRQFYYLNGRAIGDQGTDHTPSRVDYAQALRDSELEGNGNKSYIRQAQVDALPAASRDNVLSRSYRKALNVDNYQHHDIGERVIPVTSADFDQNFLPINREYPAHTPSSYVVQAGDTLQAIAAKLWGDASMWYLIADANSLQGNEALTPDLRLTIPNVVTNIHNNASTFRPFEAGLTLGNIQPTLPPPPPPPKQDGGCGTLGMILIIVVAIVVTVYTAGAASGLFATAGTTVGATAGSAGVAVMSGSAVAAGTLTAGGAMAAAAIGGAVGSIVSQGLAMAMGMQDKFSWSQVGMGAIGSGVTAGLATTGWFAEGAYGAMQQGATASAFTQGISVATGLQNKFSWSQVALSAAGSGMGYEASEWVGSALQNTQWGPTAQQFMRGFAGSLANGGMQAVLGGQSPNWGMIAAQSFGQSLSNSITESWRDGAPKPQPSIPAKSSRGGASNATSTQSLSKASIENANGQPVGTNSLTEVTEATQQQKQVARQNSVATASSSNASDYLDEIVVTANRMTIPEQILYDIAHPEILNDANYHRPGSSWAKDFSNSYVNTAKSQWNGISTATSDLYASSNGFGNVMAPMFTPVEGIGALVGNTFGLINVAIDRDSKISQRVLGYWGSKVDSVKALGGLLYDTVQGDATAAGQLAFLGTEAAVVGLATRGAGALGTADEAALLVPNSIEAEIAFHREFVGPIPEKGLRPEPSTYLSQGYQDAHAALFEGGVVRIQPTAPTGKIGRTETWVLPKSVADDAIAQSQGDIAKLEQLLGFDAGYLGKAPIRVDIPAPTGYRIPTGNEFGANEFWRPGGFTWPGALPEAVINPVLPGNYLTKPVF